MTNHSNDTNDRLLKNARKMTGAVANGIGMDIVIVSTTSKFQEDYWRKRLETTRGQIIRNDALVIAVHEDWPGGAGNGLGTLYALKKAAARAADEHQVDVFDRLRNGAAVALYHTAGKGTRLAPLPGSENNNKPAVKMPEMLNLNGDLQPMTILEGVIRQTAIFAPVRKSRLSVFWGDQIFIPANDINQAPDRHADILCRLMPMPTQKLWREAELDRYGLIAVAENGDAAQVEKIDYPTAIDLINRGVIAVSGGIGVSLGSFSISAELATALINEFRDELEGRQSKLDSDPHFWMPLSLDCQSYQSMMMQKGMAADESHRHYARMARFKSNFLDSHDDRRMLGAFDVGANSFWWDYGQLKHYRRNLLRILDGDFEASIMRTFFNITDPVQDSNLDETVHKDERSLVYNSHIRSGSIRKSVLINVNADRIEAEDAILINACSPSITCRRGLLYNVSDDKPVAATDGSVRADSYIPYSHHYTMTTNIDRDGGADWLKRLDGNELSFDELHVLNQSVDIIQAEMFSSIEHKRVRNAIFNVIW